MSDKGLSTVIATIMIVMLTMVAAAVLFAFIIPMIRENTQKSKECFDLRDQISIELGKYTCSNSANTSIMIKRGEKGEMIGFIVSLKVGGSSTRYELKDGSVTGVKMFNGSSVIKIPQKGGSETYVFSIPSVEFVDVAPILASGGNCDAVNGKVYDCYNA